MLKISASFYDPLELISPVAAPEKTIFQLLCKDKLDWNEKVSLEIEIIWREFLSNLENWNWFFMKMKKIFFLLIYTVFATAPIKFIMLSFIYVWKPRLAFE